FHCTADPRDLHSFPTRRSSDLVLGEPRVQLANEGRLSTCLGTNHGDERTASHRGHSGRSAETAKNHPTDESSSPDHLQQEQPLLHAITQPPSHHHTAEASIHEAATWHERSRRPLEESAINLRKPAIE